MTLFAFSLSAPFTQTKTHAPHTASHSFSCAKFWLMLCAVLMTLASAEAQATPRFIKATGTSNHAALSVSKYEAALIQVLGEICPSMLGSNERVQFAHAYNRQLRAFIPTSADPHETLRLLSSEPEYRATLHNVRAWTASYPRHENQALCREFAQMYL
ncbi:hypothetical protein B0181_01435 [Moraxella caviae]|uniref:DUF7944 domain-containing protein n=1 Tax=Moraxella caviae TaxID=34060 RepID=A0A1T0AAU4_9GAMM|nr:hypothetical protein [Moraxella caviae]OOR92823.1 hypothetical protein B0181_01435 [Moraxella caviae]STZ14138.1 Uncharacterised protein [Moraxella caviae]VEW10451.1 Uncharacterised protein [Moraxella caviae]